MIEIERLTLARGPRILLRETSLRVHAGERIGITGANGCGKSTLFSLLQGSLQQDQGELRMPAGWRIATMAQEVAASAQAAIDFVLDGDTEFRQLEKAIAAATGAALGELHARFAAIDGYSAAARAGELIAGLGFAPGDTSRPLAEFSGGWRLRLALARAMMCRGDLLLLDEPTNHLDLDALVWVEDWLSRFTGTLLVISHDRDFLDAVTSRIVAFENESLASYRGNYSAYEHQRAERLASQQSAWLRQQERIRQIEGFVRRFRAKATKARQAQSRLKELERMALIAPAHVDAEFELRLPCAEKVSTPLVQFERATLGYMQRPVLEGVELAVLPGQRIGLLGRNGAGKSTLVKAIAGELSPLTGARHDGENLRVGYFAQHQLDALDPDATPLLHLQRLSPGASEQSIRDFLGGYGFPGEQALAKVGRFSGGERSRLALAMIAWREPNLLLLDEPTNHLDLEMRHALTLALQAYPGAVVLVSHDRHLLRNTVDEFLLVADGALNAFDGDLEDYRALLLSSRSQQKRGETEADSARADRREERRAAANRRAELRPLRAELERLEREMEQAARKLESLETRLQDTQLYQAGNAVELQGLLREQAQLRAGIDEREERWLELSDRLERATR